MSYEKFIISATRMKFKNPLDAPGILGCTGGAIAFRPTTSYNSSNSVLVGFYDQSGRSRKWS